MVLDPVHVPDGITQGTPRRKPVLRPVGTGRDQERNATAVAAADNDDSLPLLSDAEVGRIVKVEGDAVAAAFEHRQDLPGRRLSADSRSPTFSMTMYLGLTSKARLANFRMAIPRTSSRARRVPAVLKLWHGGPPTTKLCPRPRCRLPHGPASRCTGGCRRSRGFRDGCS